MMKKHNSGFGIWYETGPRRSM